MIDDRRFAAAVLFAVAPVPLHADADDPTLLLLIDPLLLLLLLDQSGSAVVAAINLEL